MPVSSELLTAYPEPQLAAAWNASLDESRFASHYTSPEFFSEEYFLDSAPFAVLAVQGETVLGVLTGTSRGGFAVCGMHASPQVCIRDGAAEADVVVALLAGLKGRLTKQERMLTVFSWTALEGFRRAGFRERLIRAPMAPILIDLSRSPDALFREFSETRRNKVRRAIKAGVEVAELNIADDFDTYYELYAHWCNFKHVAPQPYDVQRAVFEHSGNRLVLCARHAGKIVGVSTFRYRKPGIMEYAANVSRREETRIRQNDLLLWKGIEWAAGSGLRYFSTAGSHFFLQKFGGALHTTYRYTMDRTVLRRHHAVETLHDAALSMFQKFPGGVQQAVRRLRGARGEQE
jgi:hypothetical protein